MGSVPARFVRINTQIKDSATLLKTSNESRGMGVPTIFVWSLMKRLARIISLERRARLVAATLPAKYWFRAAVLMSRWQAIVSSGFRKSRRGIAQAYLRELWLIELSRIGPFPIPMQVSGAELLKSAPADRAGVVLCGNHVPLIMVVIRAAILSGYKPDLIVTDPNNMRLENNAFQPTGLREGIPAVSPGASGLLRIRTVLRRKGLVACTLDREAGGESYPDLLVLAGRLGARAITFRAELTPEGVVEVSFQNTVHPFCESAEAIETNLKAMRDNERRVLASLDGLADSDAPISVLSQPNILTDGSGKIDESQPTVITPVADKAVQRP